MREKLIFDIASVNPDHKDTISILESKGHILYIRYLMTKRYGPCAAGIELKKMGLSAPSESVFVAYFDAIIWPAVQKYKLEALYEDYRNKLHHLDKFARYDFSRRILRYRVDLDNKLDLQRNFLLFVYYLDLDAIWSGEVFSYYGHSSRIPTDTDGTKIFDTTFITIKNTSKAIDRIVQSPKRYIIDKMLLDDVSPDRISSHCKKELGISILPHEIVLYRKVFFNIRSKSIEEKIKALEYEQRYFETQRSLYLSPSSAEGKAEIGERSAILKSIEQRLTEIKSTLYSLNAQYNQSVNNIMSSERISSEDMMQDMMRSAYSKFQTLKDNHDRDVIKPMLDLTRIVSMLSDKIDKRKESGITATGADDIYAQNEVLHLVSERIENMTTPMGAIGDLQQMGISSDDIDGLDELNVSYRDDGDRNM